MSSILDDSSLNALTHLGHFPVMLNEAVSLLNPVDNKHYLDCTFGGGGHTRKLLESANCFVTSIDRDPQAELRAEELKKEFGNRFRFVRANFSELFKLQTDNGYAGILFDFGVSSYQLDDGERGFSFMRSGPLDMRMDTDNGFTALEYLKSISERELGDVIFRYGEDPKARKIARAIKSAIESDLISTTADLAMVISSAAPSREKIHPATKTFQALRIAVNDELGSIERALPDAFKLLSSGGILAAISFHSLEDRIVKRFFKKMAGRPEDRHDHSFSQDRIKLAEILTRKPIIASETELSLNPRSRSAKLRAIRKD